MTVEILLATYNGEPYIEALLESIKQQSYPDISLSIRDDGSKDQTIDKILSCLSDWNKPWRVVCAAGAPHGVIHNFAALMSMAHPDSEYMMFADQDDVWLPQKVEKTLAEMKVQEGKAPLDTPILVHTDLKVVNNELRVLEDSFVDYVKLNSSATSLNRLLIQNNGTGCTMMINRSLLNLSLPISPDAIMHDWWLMLVASAFGRIGWVSEPTILYRQHGNNQCGAKKHSLSIFLDTERCFRFLKRRFYPQFRQGAAFYLQYKEQLPTQLKKMVKDFVDLPSQSFFKKRWLILRHCILRQQLLGNIILLAVI